MRKLGIPPENLQPDRYTGPKANLVPCVEARRRPTVLDRSYPLLTLWRVMDAATTGAEGEVWQLVRFTGADATWQRIDFTVSGTGFLDITVDALTGPGVNPVLPDGAGALTILGDSVANHSVPIETHTRGLNAFTIEVQVGSDRTGAPANQNDAGTVSFDDTAFAVDANGYVTLTGGGPNVDSIGVDSNTGPGTDPVLPTAAGLITVSGAAVAAHSVPIETHSRAANAYNIEVQVTTSTGSAPGDTDDAGLSSYNSTDFDVDSDGYVSLAGGGGGGGSVGDYSNLGIDLTSGRFSMVSSDGTALSVTNPGTVTLSQKADPGILETVQLTLPYKFDDDSHASIHDIENWHPFYLNNDPWISDRPYYIYVISHDTPTSAPAVAICQGPSATVAPGASFINVKGTIVSNDQRSFFLLEISDGAGGWTTPTIGDYEGNPCVSLGAFRMQVTDAANNDQTVQTLNSFDGLGKFHDATVFFCPGSTMGSFAGCFVQDNAGGLTDWTFSSHTSQYIIDRTGFVHFSTRLINRNGVPTSTGGSVSFNLPYNVGTLGSRTCPGTLKIAGNQSYVSLSGRTTEANYNIGNLTLNDGSTNGILGFGNVGLSYDLSVEAQFNAFDWSGV